MVGRFFIVVWKRAFFIFPPSSATVRRAWRFGPPSWPCCSTAWCWRRLSGANVIIGRRRPNKFDAPSRGLLREALGVGGRDRNTHSANAVTPRCHSNRRNYSGLPSTSINSSFSLEFMQYSARSCVYAGMSPAPADANSLDHLPDDPVVLKRMLAELLEALRKERHDREALQHRMDQLLRRLYGPRAERFDPNQPLLFAAPPAGAVVATEPTIADDADTPATPRRGQGRQRLPQHLVREPRVYALTEAERCCPCCGVVRVPLGQPTCEQLEYVPASLRVIEHVQMTYVCPRCERQRRLGDGAPGNATDTAVSTSSISVTTTEDATAETAAIPVVLTPTATLPIVNATTADGNVLSTFITAPRPAQGVARCLAAPALLAYVIVSKFVEHLPLYRLERQFARQSVPVSRQTMCDWLARSAELLTPLCHLMIQHVLQSRVIQTDDTPVPVQDDSRDHTRTGRVWLYHGDVEHDYLVYQYSPNREQQWPLTFLKKYTGFVQPDTYAGYDKLFATERIREVACWAHARRKFFEAQQTDPERPLYVLGVIRHLYPVAKRARQQQQLAASPCAAACVL